MKENKKKSKGLPSQRSLMMYIVAGIYLMYLAYSIHGSAKTAVGGQRIVLALAAIVFVVTGAVSVFSSLRLLQQGRYEGGAGDPNRGNEEETEKEAETSEENVEES